MPALPGVAELTPEDPPQTSATRLLNLQAADTRDLVLVDLIDRQGRVILTNLNTAQAAAAGALERIANQAIPVHYAIFVRAMAWFFGILVCTRLDTAGHDSVLGIVVGVLIMTLFIVAERLGHFIEEPMRNTIMDLPMYRFCATITGDLLGPDHPLARPRRAPTPACGANSTTFGHNRFLPRTARWMGGTVRHRCRGRYRARRPTARTSPR